MVIKSYIVQNSRRTLSGNPEILYIESLRRYRIPPYCGACTYIRNRPIFQGEKSASYIGAPLPVSYSAACTYIRNPKEKLNL